MKRYGHEKHFGSCTSTVTESRPCGSPLAPADAARLAQAPSRCCPSTITISEPGPAPPSPPATVAPVVVSADRAAGKCGRESLGA